MQTHKILCCLLVVLNGCAKKSDSSQKPTEVNLGTELTVAAVPEFILSVDFSSADSRQQEFWYDWREDGVVAESRRRLDNVFDQNSIAIKVSGCLEFDWTDAPHQSQACFDQNQALNFVERGPVTTTQIPDVLEDGILGKTHIALAVEDLPAGSYEMAVLFHDAGREEPQGEFEFFVDSDSGRSSLGIFTPTAGSDPSAPLTISFPFQRLSRGPIRIYIRCITSGFIINGFTITKFFGEALPEQPEYAPACESGQELAYEFLEPTLWTRRFSSDPGAPTFPGPFYSKTPRLAGDFNGDGRDDIVFLTNEGVYLAVSSPNKIGTPQLWLPADGDRFKALDQQTKPFAVGDFDGNGRDDLVYFGSKRTEIVYNHAKQDRKFEPLTSEFAFAAGWQNRSEQPRLIDDIDGNGSDDIVGFKDGQLTLAMTGGTAPAKLELNSYEAAGLSTGSARPKFLGDINGDGSIDIVSVEDAGLFTSLGGGASKLYDDFSLQTTGFSPASGWASQDATPRLIGIFARGKNQGASLIGLKDGKFKGIRPGEMGASEFTIDELASFASSKDELQNYSFERDPFLSGDMNGDGIDDLIYFGYQGTYVSLTVQRCR